MKKLLALMLALMLALTCAASAETVYTRLTFDRELAGEMLPGFGVPEEQLGMVDAILSVVNALGLRVTAVEDGAQLDLELNGANALSVGWATDAESASIVSTLFPNYCLTIQNQTVESIIAQMAASMPGAGGEGGAGGLDMTAIQEVLGGHLQKWMTACAAAGQPGEPVPGDYEIDGMTFDTMIPVTVDMPAVKAATQTLLDELLADEAAAGMIKGMLQGMAQNGGQALDEADFETSFRAGFEEWMAHFPDTVTAELYVNDGDETGAFYMYAESVYEGSEEPFFTCDMLYEGEQKMDMGFTMQMKDDETSETMTMEAGFALEGSDMKLYFDMAGMYFGLNLSFRENAMTLDVFFMNAEKPLLTVNVETADGGERTLPVDAAGKTVLSVEEIMADGNGAGVQGLYADIQNNGLAALLGTAMQAVPELGALLSAFSGQMAG